MRGLAIKYLDRLVKHPSDNTKTATEDGSGLRILREIKKEVIHYLGMMVVVWSLIYHS